MKRNFSLKAFLLLCLFTISINVFSQTTYDISPEISGQLSNYDKIWSVEEKEIDYYPIIDTVVYSSSYQSLLNDLEKKKDKYEEYLIEKEQDSINHLKEIKIRDLVNSFLTSKKDKSLLDQAQRLSEEINLELSISVKVYSHFEQQRIYIKQNGRYSSKKDLTDYLNVLDKRISNYKPVKPWGKAFEYIQISEDIKSFPEERKYETIKQPSKNSHKKSAYFASNSVDKSLLTGTFNEIYNKVHVATKPKDTYQLNELTEECDGFYRHCDVYYHLLQNINTKEYFLVKPEMISSIKRATENDEALEYLKSKNIKVIERPVPGYELKTYSVVETKNSYIDFSIFAKEFKKDESYGSRVDKFWSDYEDLQNQIISYEQSLEKYSNIHSIKGFMMSSADINSWKSVTNKVVSILSKLSKLTDDNFSIYNSTKSKKNLVGKSEYVVDLIIYSRSVLEL